MTHDLTNRKEEHSDNRNVLRICCITRDKLSIRKQKQPISVNLYWEYETGVCPPKISTWFHLILMKLQKEN